MWPLFIPLALVVAILMLFFGAAAFLVAVVHQMPWLLILAGLWLLLSGQRGKGRARRTRAAVPQPPPAPMPPPPAQQQPSPARPEARPSRVLPIDLQVKVEQIQRKADVLLGYADRFPPCSQDLHLVRQTTAEYLPETIAAYLALPGDDDPVVPATGKTALQELTEQLQILDARLDDIAQDLQRQDLGRLLANRRFLEERFGLRERETRVDPPRQETGAA